MADQHPYEQFADAVLDLRKEILRALEPITTPILRILTRVLNRMQRRDG